MAKEKELVSVGSLPLVGDKGRRTTDPSRQAGVWRLQQRTWVCSRSWGWVKDEVSAVSALPAVQPPSPGATARPSCPSRLLRGRCWISAAAFVQNWRKAGIVAGTGWIGVWCWPVADDTGVL